MSQANGKRLLFECYHTCEQEAELVWSEKTDRQGVAVHKRKALPAHGRKPQVAEATVT